MYLESEFALLQAQNEQLTRENKKLAAVLNWLLNTIPVPEIELARSVWGNTNTACVLEARAKAVEALTPEECTCLPDGRAHGHCPDCEADNSKEIPY